MTNIQTQCPSCQSTYPIPESQTTNTTAKARCPKCQTVFTVNDNRINEKNNNDSKPSDTNTINASSDNRKFSEESSDANDDNILASVDDMSEWLNQQTGSVTKNKSKDKSDDSTIPTGDTVNKSLNSPTSELSDLMTNYGVVTDHGKLMEGSVEKNERIAKMRKRVIDSSPTSQQVAQKTSPLVFLLWLLGCILLVLLLLAQYVIFNINTLVTNPQHNDKLTKVCELLSCSLPSTNANVLEISKKQYFGSKVKPSKTHTDIVAVIVNQSNESQLSPKLKFSIQGKNGLIGEFVAEPKDYMIVEQEQISKGQIKPFMVTIAVKSKDITDVTIKTFH